MTLALGGGGGGGIYLASSICLIGWDSMGLGKCQIKKLLDYRVFAPCWMIADLTVGLQRSHCGTRRVQ